jgi:hypothetical protein
MERTRQRREEREKEEEEGKKKEGGRRNEEEEEKDRSREAGRRVFVLVLQAADVPVRKRRRLPYLGNAVGAPAVPHESRRIHQVFLDDEVRSVDGAVSSPP